jgi:PKD repeat protein
MKKQLLLLAIIIMATFKMNAQCSAAYSYSSTPAGVFTFTATNNNAPSAIYTWSLGNGVAASGNIATANYNSVGNYYVCLTVVDTFSGCTDSTCQIIIVGSTLGQCNSNFTYTTDTSGYTSFTATGVSVNASTCLYAWNLGNGNTPSGVNVSTTYMLGQTYPVTLTVTDPVTSCQTTTSQQVTLTSPNVCQAGYYIYPDSTAGPHTYVGVNTSTGANLAYTWSWGDGTSATGPYPSHTYATAGNYTICLYISNPATGCVDSFCAAQTINKTDAMVTIDFQAPSGVENISKSGVSIFPNPAKDLFTINGIGGSTMQVDIYTINGSKVKSIQVKVNEQISISSLPANLYLLKVTDSEGISRFAKLIKQ